MRKSNKKNEKDEIDLERLGIIKEPSGETCPIEDDEPEISTEVSKYSNPFKAEKKERKKKNKSKKKNEKEVIKKKIRSISTDLFNEPSGEVCPIEVFEPQNIRNAPKDSNPFHAESDEEIKEIARSLMEKKEKKKNGELKILE